MAKILVPVSVTRAIYNADMGEWNGTLLIGIRAGTPAPGSPWRKDPWDELRDAVGILATCNPAYVKAEEDMIRWESLLGNSGRGKHGAPPTGAP